MMPAYGLVGASGRMGTELKRVLTAELCCYELDSSGERERGVPTVMLDFSRPEVLFATVAACRRFGCGLVMGTTGLTEEHRAALVSLSASVPVVQSANFSVGVAVLSMMLADYGPLLADWDCEIVEAHHSHKKDAPSGTALALKAAVGRDVPIHALRLGGLPGDHVCLFAGEGELLTLSHRAISRAVFAQGAMRAARFAVTAAPGLYSFAQVLRHEREDRS